MQDEQQFNDMIDLQALSERFLDIRRAANAHALSVPVFIEDVEPEPENSDPTLTIFYEPQDQGDG